MDVDTLLGLVRDRLRSPPSCGVPEVDRVVVDALRPGKLLRPDLLVRSAAAADGERAADPDAEERAVTLALAVELLHVATLVHDDIIDGAAVRRGRPSVVASAGVGTAIVVGDLLLARGAAAAAGASGPAAGVWARALERMAQGQLREDGLAAAPSLEAYAEYASLKTAELFRASAELGALAVGAPAGVVEAHGRFGLHFGRAFQHLDDLLDAVGNHEQMGKPTGSDAANHVPTAVSLLAGGGSPLQVADLVEAEVAAARSALPPGRATVLLGDWGEEALRHVCAPVLDPDGRLRAGRLAAAPDP
ncbi:polyprenyl synthetase family protein [Nocardioides sp. zg-DK7169]|uniref:polyprenyl synthetase family protein n=1 Tax=Nocardioides sp. zg-DK7169 TaxID=2736600 RepID=UPI0015571FA0|nr:polyprenyl synthetase family protein [Nocardioides sp. zg-DK7169]NPC96205.1 polyprenyl synthetase family protein [Nocardioides sp. zg-DK7169]